EVVVTPLVAYPLLLKSIERNKENYSCSWTSGDFHFQQYNWYEYKEERPAKFLSSIQLDGKFNFKGSGKTKRLLKLQVETAEATPNFKKAEIHLDSTFFRQTSTKIYDLFHQYEFIGSGKGRPKGTIFELNEDFGKRYRKVIDFDTLDGQKHYLIKTQPTVRRIDHNEGRIAMKESLKESLRITFPKYSEAKLDSVVNEAINKAPRTEIGSDLLGYIWIDTENLGIRKVYYKHEFYGSNGKSFNKIHRLITYQVIDGIYYPEKIEILEKKMTKEDLFMYHYSVFQFGKYQLKKEFEKISNIDILGYEANLTEVSIQESLSFEEYQKKWKKLINSNFVLPLRGTVDAEVKDFLR
ncbi:MAG: hypothetical protein AAFO07_19635, partial [Bacteroidota bacterium]